MIEHAQVVVTVDGEPVADADLEIQVEPGQALLGWSLTNIELHQPSTPLATRENMTCWFKDIMQAVAFLGAADPSRFGKDQ